MVCSPKGQIRLIKGIFRKIKWNSGKTKTQRWTNGNWGYQSCWKWCRGKINAVISGFYLSGTTEADQKHLGCHRIENTIYGCSTGAGARRDKKDESASLCICKTHINFYQYRADIPETGKKWIDKIWCPIQADEQPLKHGGARLWNWCWYLP